MHIYKKQIVSLAIRYCPLSHILSQTEPMAVQSVTIKQLSFKVHTHLPLVYLQETNCCFCHKSLSLVQCFVLIRVEQLV